jgi:hypothetical protein
MTCGAVRNLARQSDMSTGFYRPVMGHPSKHGANVGAKRSRPLPRAAASRGIAVRRDAPCRLRSGLSKGADTLGNPAGGVPGPLVLTAPSASRGLRAASG